MAHEHQGQVESIQQALSLKEKQNKRLGIELTEANDRVELLERSIDEFKESAK